MGAARRILLLVTMSFCLLAHKARAETLYHMNSTVWGCFDPNVTPTINDPSNPEHSDPQWVAQTAAQGQCVLISSTGLWKARSAFNGMTYITNSGPIGSSGSYWVPNSAIDFSSPVHTVPTAPQAHAPMDTSQAQPKPAPVNPAAQPAPQDQPAASDATSTSSATPSEDTGSSGGAVIIVLVALAACWMIGRSLSKGSKKRTKKAVGTKVRPVATANSHTQATSITIQVQPPKNVSRPVPSPGKPGFDWKQPGTTVSVAGITISGGMIYVGRAGDSWTEHDASFIDPTLSVAPRSTTAVPLGYWPSYRRITPECRHQYLEWLSSGRSTPDQDIGYVFLYFYGLERRLFIDSPPAEEIHLLASEVKRLRSIYAHNSSFNGYSTRLLEAVTFLHDAELGGNDQFVPDLAAPPGEIPLALQVAIAREVVSGRPISFEFAAGALFGIREFWSVNKLLVEEKGREAFLSVFKSRFAASFPSGFLLRNRKDSHLQLNYRGASPGLQVDLAKRAGLKGLPNPATLTWTKLLNLATAVAEDITPYLKTLAYYPARANSLLGLIGCPAELRGAVAAEAQQWAQALPVLSAVAFSEVAGHAIGTTTAKWNVRHRRQVSEALAGVGYSMEPEPEDNSERLEDNTMVQIYRGTDRTPSRSVEVAFAAAMLVAIVAKTAGHGAEEIAKIWLPKAALRLPLTFDQELRVEARLAWLSTKHVTVLKAKKLLGEATFEDREFCAWSVTVAAGMTGTVGKVEVAILEAIYDALSVPRHTLYAGLHEGIGAAAKAASEPILVSNPVPELVHEIPRPPAELAAETSEHTAQIRIDSPENDGAPSIPSEPIVVSPAVQELLHQTPPQPTESADDTSDRLTRIREETDRVAALLKSIFVEEEPETSIPEPVGGATHAGLDDDHAKLLTRLLTQLEWPRGEFDKVASDAGLMPGGAMETINEWAFDYYGDALLEDGDPVIVNHALLPMEAEVGSVE